MQKYVPLPLAYCSLNLRMTSRFFSDAVVASFRAGDGRSGEGGGGGRGQRDGRKIDPTIHTATACYHSSREGNTCADDARDRRAGIAPPRAARGDRARGRATIRRGRSTHPRRGLSRRRRARRGARGAARGTSPPTLRGASRSTTASRRIARETRTSRAWTASCARGESSTDEGVSSDERTTGRVRRGAATA